MCPVRSVTNVSGRSNVQPGDIDTFVTFVSGRSMFIKAFDTVTPSLATAWSAFPFEHRRFGHARLLSIGDIRLHLCEGSVPRHRH